MKENVYVAFENLRDDVKRILDLMITKSSLSVNFLLETKVVLNKFSDADNYAKFTAAFQKGI